MCCKLKIFGGVVWSTFTDDVVPVEKQCYLCIAAIDIDSVLKVDKKVYPQAYLEQCKYKLKKLILTLLMIVNVVKRANEMSEVNLMMNN